MVSSCAVHGERGTEEEERQRRRGQRGLERQTIRRTEEEERQRIRGTEEEDRQRRRGQRGFYQNPSGESSPNQDLTDYRGCTLDTEVMPNFNAAFNSMTGVKKLSATFPIFKFPGRSKLTFRCTVLVCRKNCPVAKCDRNEENPDSPNSEFQNVKIMEKFLVETSVEVVDKGDPNFDFLNVEKSSKKVSSFEAASRSDLDVDRPGSNLLHQTSALQLEVGTKIVEQRKASQPGTFKWKFMISIIRYF